jgi:hypothetical protein
MAMMNRIMINGPKADGAYVVEFRTAAGEAMVISIPRTEAAVIRHFQERMPYGLFVPEVSFTSEHSFTQNEPRRSAERQSREPPAAGCARQAQGSVNT